MKFNHVPMKSQFSFRAVYCEYMFPYLLLVMRETSQCTVLYTNYVCTAVHHLMMERSDNQTMQAYLNPTVIQLSKRLHGYRLYMFTIKLANDCSWACFLFNSVAGHICAHVRACLGHLTTWREMYTH